MNDLKDFDKSISQITKEQWHQLFDLIPVITKTKNFGKISPIKKTEEGYFTFPHMQPSKIVSSFQYIVYEIGIIHTFDWGHWDEGRKLAGNPKTDFNKLDIKTLCMLITTIVRNDRFCDGALVSAFEDGTMLRLLKALKVNIEKQTSNYKQPKFPKYARAINAKLQNVQVNKTKTKLKSSSKQKKGSK